MDARSPALVTICIVPLDQDLRRARQNPLMSVDATNYKLDSLNASVAGLRETFVYRTDRQERHQEIMEAAMPRIERRIDTITLIVLCSNIALLLLLIFLLVLQIRGGL